MDRASALRILGVSEAASESEIVSSYWALRAHVEERLEGQPAGSSRSQREAELRELESVLRWARGAGGEPRRSREREQSGSGRWLLVAAGAATVLALAIGLALATRDGASPPPVVASGDGGAPGAGATGAPDAPRAQLVARADRAGAVLEIRRAGADAVQVAGPADATVYGLLPDEYDLRVVHPECPEAWSQRLAVEAGERHELVPELCEAETGSLVVRSNVDGDELTIDGEAVGTTGPDGHSLEPGAHRVRVEKPGYAPWESVVEVSAGQQVTLLAQLGENGQSTRRSKRNGAAPAPATPPPARPQAEPSSPGRTSQSESGSPDAGPPEVDRRRMEGWHETMTRWLISRYDHDRSGKLDSPDEVASIACDEWRGLEQSHDAAGFGIPLSRFYGFYGSEWKQEALGFSYEMRGYAYERMKECGLR